MIPVPASTKIWLAGGVTDCGMNCRYPIRSTLHSTQVEEIKTIKVLETWVDGRQVYAATPIVSG